MTEGRQRGMAAAPITCKLALERLDAIGWMPCNCGRSGEDKSMAEIRAASA